MEPSRSSLNRQVLFGDRIWAPAEPVIAVWRKPLYPGKYSLEQLKHRAARAALATLMVLAACAVVAVILRTSGVIFCFGMVPGLQYFRRVWYSFRNGHADRALEHLVDYPSNVPQIPVQIFLTVDKVPLGQDSGLVSFCDGWLHYQGLRTSFSLHRSNVAIWPSSDRALGSPIHLTYDLLGGREKLSIYPNDKMGKIHDSGWNDFLERFVEWNRTDLDLTGSPVFPPNRADPDYIQRKEIGLLALWALSLLAVPTVWLLVAPFVSGTLCGVACVLVALLWIRTHVETIAYRKMSALAQPAVRGKNPAQATLPGPAITDAEQTLASPEAEKPNSSLLEPENTITSL